MIEPKVLKTKYLFLNLLYFFRPGVVLDVGSMNGADSLRFRRMAPDARLFAYEANPHLYRAMQENPEIARAGIQVANMAVSPAPGSIKFFVSREARTALGAGNRGTSSTLRRLEPDAATEEIEVPTIRLDQALHGATRAALWIDVEGAGYDVLATLGAAAASVDFIHIETELRPQWQGQKLKDAVIGLAQSMGFALVAHSAHLEQQDLVFVNRRLLDSDRAKVRTALLLTRIHGPGFSRLLGALS